MPDLHGDGVERIEMQFLSDVTLDCPDCEGKRFGPEALAITWNGLNVAEVLELTISEARDLFRDYHDIYGPLKALVDVGLGYLRMGQRLTTLSGGESQRLKLLSTRGGTHRVVEAEVFFFWMNQRPVCILMTSPICSSHWTNWWRKVTPL